MGCTVIWLLRYWLSLVVRRRIVGMASSGVTVRECDPKEHGNSVLTLSSSSK